jgi:hypothetical protein
MNLRRREFSCEIVDSIGLNVSRLGFDSWLMRMLQWIIWFHKRGTLLTLWIIESFSVDPLPCSYFAMFKCTSISTNMADPASRTWLYFVRILEFCRLIRIRFWAWIFVEIFLCCLFMVDKFKSFYPLRKEIQKTYVNIRWWATVITWGSMWREAYKTLFQQLTKRKFWHNTLYGLRFSATFSINIFRVSNKLHISGPEFKNR